MKRMKLFIKSIGYSFFLIKKSSGLLIWLYFLLSILSVTLPLINSFILKVLLDELTIKTITSNVIILCMLLYVLTIVLLQGINSAKDICYSLVFKKAEHNYESDLLEKLEKLPISFIDSSKGKNMIDDVKYARNTAVYLSYRIIQIISMLYSFIVAFTTLVTFNILFSVIFLVLTVPGIIVNVIFDGKADYIRRKTAPDVRKFCYYRWMLTDVWPAKDIRMYDLTESIKERYDSEKEEYCCINKMLDKKKMIWAIIMEIIRRSGEIAFVVYIVYAALLDEITIGEVTLYTSFALLASNSFQTMVNIFVMGYVRTTEIMERFFEFIKIECPDEKSNVRKLGEFKSIRFEDVYFKYPLTDKYILAGTSFAINKGDKVSIIGLNGSGKSTIIKLMLGLYEIESGEIFINDYPIADYAIQDVRKMFSVLFQDFVKYPLALRDNIALSNLSHRNNDYEIEMALKQSGVYNEILKKLENGLDSYMTRKFDDNGTELSKGQWQKIALARAYFKDAEIIICDEPSAALDAEAEDKIFRNFEGVSENKTSIMISHRISAARMSNKIIVLDEGKIVENGNHDSLIELNGMYAKLYKIQRDKYIVKE